MRENAPQAGVRHQRRPAFVIGSPNPGASTAMAINRSSGQRVFGHRSIPRLEHVQRLQHVRKHHQVRQRKQPHPAGERIEIERRLFVGHWVRKGTGVRGLESERIANRIVGSCLLTPAPVSYPRARRRIEMDLGNRLGVDVDCGNSSPAVDDFVESRSSTAPRNLSRSSPSASADTAPDTRNYRNTPSSRRGCCRCRSGAGDGRLDQTLVELARRAEVFLPQFFPRFVALEEVALIEEFDAFADTSADIRRRTLRDRARR